MRHRILRFSLTYFLITIVIFAIEACIACFLHDSFVRPYFGDALVVVLIYCFVRSFLDIGIRRTAILVFIFAVSIEFLQYIHFVAMIGLERSKLACIVLGNSFSWEDIVAYASGITAVMLTERNAMRK